MKTLWIRAAIAASSLVACGGPTPTADTGADAGALDAALDGESDASVSADSALDTANDGSTAADAAPLAPAERATIVRKSDTCVSAPTDFGTYGAVTQYDRFEIANPAWVGGAPIAVQAFVPVGGAATHPVLFYAHPFGGNDWTRMRSMFEFWVSQDYVVVYAPYATSGASVCERYDTLWGGFSRAVDLLSARAGMDTTRVGFIGHSFGGGAVPWLATEAVRARGWGASGIFMMPNAPWYSYRMDAARWSALPASARLHVMVFDEDDLNDHRIAIEDQWTPFPRAKQWINLRSAMNGSCSQLADHLVPTTDSTLMDSVRLNGLDYWGVWRHSHALASCVLRADASACAVIDGSNAALQTTMGTWRSDNTAVTAAQRSDAPSAPRPSSAYMFGVNRRALFPCEGRGM